MSTVLSVSIRRWNSIVSASRVNSSTTCSSLRLWASAVWSNRRSITHTQSGRRAGSRLAGTVEVPGRWRLRRFLGRPSSRHTRRVRLMFSDQPSSSSSRCARRYPHRGRSGEIPQVDAQRRIVVGHAGLMTLGRAMLTGQPARRTLRHPQPIPRRGHGTTSTRRAQKFPLASSLRTSGSSTPPEQSVGRPQLANDLLRYVTSTFHRCAPLTHSPGSSDLSHGSDRSSHTGRTDLRRPGQSRRWGCGRVGPRGSRTVAQDLWYRANMALRRAWRTSRPQSLPIEPTASTETTFEMDSRGTGSIYI